MSKRVKIIHTGGTFGMMISEGEQTVRQPEGLLQEILNQVPELRKIADLSLDILCNLDSSDVEPFHWKNLAQKILEAWEEADGFVVIHGTDTMTYTASALAFFLSGLTKSIVFTGSQRPLRELRNDARANIIDAIELATFGLPEVLICFDSEVHRATRATKFSSQHMHAFASPNFLILGAFGVNFRAEKAFIKTVIAPEMRHKPVIDTRIESRIICLDCIPGINFSAALIEHIVTGCQGIVLKGYGAGNLPIAPDTPWQKICEAAAFKEIPVVMTTQCPSGSVNLNAYENGRVFQALGVISGMDMTLEALSVKLMVMLGRKVPYAERFEFFKIPLADECSRFDFS